MTRKIRDLKIRDLIVAVIVAIALIFLGGALLDRIAGSADGEPGYVSLAVWLAWDIGALLVVISLVWLWRRYQRNRSAHRKDRPTP